MMDKNEMIMLNQGRYFFVKAETNVLNKWLVFAPDGQFFHSYPTEDDARDACIRYNEKGQAEQRHKDAMSDVLTLTFPEHPLQPIWWYIHPSKRWLTWEAIVPPSTY